MPGLWGIGAAGGPEPCVTVDLSAATSPTGFPSFSHWVLGNLLFPSFYSAVVYLPGYSMAFKLFQSEFLTEEQLNNLKLYKYSAVDKSFTTRLFLRHYWNWSIELFPLWIAQVVFILGVF